MKGEKSLFKGMEKYAKYENIYIFQLFSKIHSIILDKTGGGGSDMIYLKRKNLEKLLK